MEQKEELLVIRHLDELEDLQGYLADKDMIAFDTETTGVDKESKIIGFSVCAEVDLGAYVILSYWDPEQKKMIELETMKGAKAFMRFLATKTLIMQNAPFDCSMVENNFGVNLMPQVHTDTLVLGHLLNENRRNGLKERGVELFGDDARKEQLEMQQSVYKNGGVLTKQKYELYKADPDLLAHYGAKDAVLTLKVFLNDVPLLFDEKLDKFFYDDESMPLLRGPTYDMNTTGLRVDPERLETLRKKLEVDCMEAKAFVMKEIQPLVQDKYPAKSARTTFNIGASQQLGWLLFERLQEDFALLTKEGKVICKFLELRLPYTKRAKWEFVQAVKDNAGRVYQEAKFNPKTGKMARPKTIGNYWKYMASGKVTLAAFTKKYKWVERLLEYKKNEKLLNTYVIGIQSRMKYNIIRPNFLQHGTTSGRYSCKNPNFQNLPRDDKRVKSCIISRPGKVFIGADYSQLEPRVFASYSQDERLMGCFTKGEDFYSVTGLEIFDRHGYALFKDEKGSFAKTFPDERQQSKTVSLAATYGKQAHSLAPLLGVTTERAQEILDAYFERFPSVKRLMLESHEQAKADGVVYNLFGRPRRMPKAKLIPKLYGKATDHAELPYEARNLLNLSINHRIQSTGASIVNRSAITFWRECRARGEDERIWLDVKIVVQVHDELIVEAPVSIAEAVRVVLKAAMENAVTLPGVALVAEPKIADNLADLK